MNQFNVLIEGGPPSVALVANVAAIALHILMHGGDVLLQYRFRGQRFAADRTGDVFDIFVGSLDVLLDLMHGCK